MHHNPLSTYLLETQKLFTKAKSNNNPAKYLFDNGARTLLFNAQAIGRILYAINNEEHRKFLKSIKKIEDILGIIDYYVTLQKLATTKNKPAFDECSKKIEKNYSKLNKRLLKKDFYAKLLADYSNPKKINFNTAVNKAFIRDFLKQELAECESFYLENANQFKDIELHLHEMRRKIRWISIYAQALNGLVQIKSGTAKYSWEKEFISETEKKSPFNKLPKNTGIKTPIEFNQKAFYALSRVILELGKLKDEGQLNEFKSDYVAKTGSSSTALKQTKLMQKANQLLNSYFVQYKINSYLFVN
jgi:hypothetical protein